MAMSRADPYRDETVRRVAARAPLGFAIFLGCLALSAIFDVLRFPERLRWMTLFGCLFVTMVAVSWSLIRLRPERSVGIVVCFVNLLGVGITAYHVIVRAPVAMCVWQLTALLATSSVVLPWGSRNQALACLGTLVAYPLYLISGASDPLTWGAGGAYLLVVLSLSMFAASLLERSVRSDLTLTAALSDREARLRSYFDLALVGTAVVSPDGIFREINDELCHMFGYTRAELAGLSWPMLVDRDMQSAAAALLLRAHAGAGTPERLETRCVRKDGSAIDAIISARGLPGPHGSVNNVMLLMQDVTERRRVEAEREENLRRVEAARQDAVAASRAKDAFLATVSHELRTPLTPILAWSGLLRQGRVTATQTEAALAAVERNAKAQAQLIDDLLDVSRIVSGKWRLSMCPTDLASVVRAALEAMEPAFHANGVSLDVRLPDAPVSLRGDPDRLQQVVANLLSNGVKFTPRGGRVEVVLERVEGFARLIVRDTGEGISPEFLPHVFEPFRQADNSNTREHRGVGLGLAIARALVERHGGAVRAESDGPGRGAVFTVELPLVSDAALATSGDQWAARAAPRASLHGLNVLVVDDDSDSNTVVRALLASFGAEVRTALSAREALDIAIGWQPDVLVSDIAMPGEDGYALLRKLRARGGALGRVPAIALTALGGPADRVRSGAAGYQMHVTKPFDADELAAAVERAAARSVRPTA